MNGISAKRLRCESSTTVEEGSASVSNTMLPAGYWQVDTKSVKERDMYLLENNIHTDVTFIVGKEKQSFPCHRLFLAKSSPVFDSMLFVEGDKNVPEIYIPDVTPQAFKSLLIYIYSAKLEIESDQAGWEVMYAAKKYALPHIYLEEIREYLTKYILGNKKLLIWKCNVWTTIDLATKNNEQDLLDLTWQEVTKKIPQNLAHKNFLTAPLSVVESLVQRDDLYCSELELLNACLRWAKHEANAQNLDPNPESLRKILAPILPHIRVLNLEKLKPLQEVLSKSDITAITQRKVPPNFCSDETQRYAVKPKFFLAFPEPKVIKPYLYTSSGIDEYETIPTFTYRNQASGEFHTPNTEVYGLVIPTQLKTNAEIDTYDEDVTIYFIESTYPYRTSKYRHEVDGLELIDSIVEVINFTSTVKYNSSAKCYFNKPSSFEEDDTIDGNHLHFKIIFHKYGKYPYKGDKFLVPILEEPTCEEKYPESPKNISDHEISSEEHMDSD